MKNLLAPSLAILALTPVPSLHAETLARKITNIATNTTQDYVFTEPGIGSITLRAVFSPTLNGSTAGGAAFTSLDGATHVGCTAFAETGAGNHFTVNGANAEGFTVTVSLLNATAGVDTSTIDFSIDSVGVRVINANVPASFSWTSSATPLPTSTSNGSSDALRTLDSSAYTNIATTPYVGTWKMVADGTGPDYAQLSDVPGSNGLRMTATFQASGQRIWNGTPASGGSVWDTTSSNWLDDASAPATFTNGLPVIFNDSAVAKNVTIAAGEIQPGFISFNAFDDYSITGPGSIGGTGSLSLTGGKVSLATALNLSGTITVSSGSTLQLDAGGSLGSASIASSGTLVLNSSAPIAIAAPITGSGSLSHQGTGTSTFSAAVSASGIDIDQGTMVFTNTLASTSQDIAGGSVLELRTDTAKSYSSMGFFGAGTLRKTGTSSAIWGASTANFAMDPGGLIDVQAGSFIGGSSANEIWTNNKAGLQVAEGATFDGVEATVTVDAITGGGAIRTGLPGFPNAAIICGVADGSGIFTGSIGNYTPNPSAVGQVIKRGTGTQTLAGANTYTGNTTVEEGSLVLDTAGSLTFKPGANGVSNRITGAGSVTLSGTFNLDLATADLTPGNSWNLVDVDALDENYGESFVVSGFTEASGVWTTTAGSNVWTFTEADGNLTLSAAAGYSNWATTNAGGDGPDLDFDGDGVKNGIEYFMGQTGSSFTAMPGPVTSGGATSVTWTRNPAATVASFEVQFSATLGNDWAPVPAGEVNLTDPTKVIYTFPAPLSGKRFVRLSVTP